jgi:hypothetical protein
MPSSRSAFLAGLLAAGLLACDAQGWLRAGGVRAFREVGADEARELLAEPELVLVEVRGGALRAPGLGATLVGEDDPLPPTLLGVAGRVLVVASEVGPGRRVCARLVRAGAAHVSLVVADPRELAAGVSRRGARPAEG